MSKIITEIKTYPQQILQKMTSLQQLNEQQKVLKLLLIVKELRIMIEVQNSQNIQKKQIFIGLGNEEDYSGYQMKDQIQWIHQHIINNHQIISYYDYLSFCLSLLPQIYLQSKEWYLQLVQKQPNCFQLKYGLANLYYNNQQYDEALYWYNKCIEINPSFVKTYQILIFMHYFHLHSFKQAHKYLNKALQCTNPNVYTQFMSILLQSSIEKQIQDLKALSITYPRYLRILNNIGRNYTSLNQYQNAIYYLQQCIKRNPKYATPYFNLALVYQHNQQIQKSISYLQLCYSYDPKFYYAQIRIGTLQYKYLDQYDAASELIKKGLLHEQNKLIASLQLGKLNNKRKNFQQAIFWFLQCIKIKQDCSSFYGALGTVYENIGQYQTAIQYHRKCLQLNSKEFQSVVSLADCYYALNKDEESLMFYKLIDVYDQQIKIMDKSLYNYGMIYMKQSQFDKALKIFQEGLRRYPMKLMFYIKLAFTYIKLHRYDQIQWYVTKAKQIYEKDQNKQPFSQEQQQIYLLSIYDLQQQKELQLLKQGCISLKRYIGLEKQKYNFQEKLKQLYQISYITEDHLY